MSTKKISPEERQALFATKTYLLNNLHKHYTIAQLAAHTLMTEEKFKDCFYKLFEIHVSDYALEARMQLSKFLLLGLNE